MDSWINKERFSLPIKRFKNNEKTLKNTEIPILEDYSKDPGPEFWENFPFTPLPKENSLHTPILVDEFEKEFLNLKDDLIITQCKSILQCIQDLRYGADSLVNEDLLSPLCDSNAKNMSQQKIGSFYTDQLVTMQKKKYISGPFSLEDPPIENVRINSLFAVEQHDKYRPILNLSAPKGNSFNEAIPDDKMEKVIMSSPVLVAKKLFMIGRGAFLSKIDHQSAYKLIPVKLHHLYLQGFVWLDKLFIETSQIFGARSSVPNYDRFHKSFSDMVVHKTSTPRLYLERQLDDQIIMTKTLSENKKFVEEYISMAKTINLPLAPFDKPDKAFLYQQEGVILGIRFNTLCMKWFLPEEKRSRYLTTLEKLLSKVKVTQNDIQQVMGMLNTIMQLCPPLKFLRSPLIDDLGKSYTIDPLFLSSESIMFFNQWMYILHDLKDGFPIPDFNNCSPAKAVVFVSDAAGCADPNIKLEYDVGIGAVGHLAPNEEMCDFLYVSQCLWPTDFISVFSDVNNKAFGCKTTLLEAIGLILPIYHNYRQIHHKHIVCKVDNVAVVWAYWNGRSRSDPYTSLIVSVINHIAVSTPFKLYVEHLPRVSTLPALLADTLSRTDPKGRYLIDHIGLEVQSTWPPSLVAWLNNPVIDWSLRSKILQDCRNTL